jgi:8-oxo-dGTP pyrophosphatase MutT (NUDIX family)
LSETEKPVLPASTVMLLRDGPRGLEVFMVVRHHEIDSFSGALVFPGGKVEEADFRARGFTRHSRDIEDRELAFRVGAIREAFEECGVLLARPTGSRVLVDAKRLKSLEATYRQALVKDELSIVDVCERESLELATETLIPYAHWITPVVAPKIFDTHFFLAPAPSDQIALHDGEESTDSTWIRPRDALAEAGEGKRTIVFPTQMNLRKLSQWDSVAEALSACMSAKVITVQPTVQKHPEGRLLTIPADAGYGGSQFLAQQDGDKLTVIQNVG